LAAASPVPAVAPSRFRAKVKLAERKIIFNLRVRFDSAVNPKTALELGLTIPTSIFGRADEVIE
jgi:hypothetical protein